MDEILKEIPIFSLQIFQKFVIPKYPNFKDDPKVETAEEMLKFLNQEVFTDKNVQKQFPSYRKDIHILNVLITNVIKEMKKQTYDKNVILLISLYEPITIRKKMEEITNSVIYIFQKYIKNKFIIFKHNSNVHIALRIKKELQDLKENKKIEQEYLDDGIHTFKSDIDYLINLIDGFIIDNTINKNENYEMFLNLFKIQKVSSHFLDLSVLQSETKQGSEISYDEVTNELISCEKNIQLLKVLSQNTIIGLHEINNTFIHIKPMKKFDKDYCQEYIQSLLEDIRGVLKHNKDILDIKNEKIKHALIAFEKVVDLLSKYLESEDKEYIMSFEIIQPLIKSLNETLQEEKEMKYISTASGAFGQNYINELLLRQGVSTDKIKKFNLTEETGVINLLNDITANVYQIYINNGITLKLLTEFIDAITNPNTKQGETVSIYVNTYNAIKKDKNFIIKRYNDYYTYKIKNSKDDYTKQMFEHVLMEPKNHEKIKQALLSFAEDNSLTSDQVKGRSLLYNKFDDILFGENNIRKQEFEFNLKQLSEQTIQTLKIKGIDTKKFFTVIELLDLFKNIYSELENKNVDIIYRMINASLFSIKDINEDIRSIEIEIKTYIDKLLKKKTTKTTTINAFYEILKEIEESILTKINIFIQEIKTKQQAEKKIMGLTPEEEKTLKEFLIQDSNNILYDQMIMKIDNVIEYLTAHEQFDMVIEYQKLQKELKEKIIHGSDDKSVGINYYVKFAMDKLKQIHSEKFGEYIDQKYHELTKNSNMKISNEVKAFNKFFANILHKPEDEREQSAQFNNFNKRINDIIFYKEHKMELFGKVLTAIVHSSLPTEIDIHTLIDVLKQNQFSLILPNEMSHYSMIKTKPNEIQIISNINLKSHKMFLLNKNTPVNLNRAFGNLEIKTNKDSKISLQYLQTELETAQKKLEQEIVKIQKEKPMLMYRVRRFVNEVISENEDMTEIDSFFQKNYGYTICLS